PGRVSAATKQSHCVARPIDNDSVRPTPSGSPLRRHGTAFLALLRLVSLFELHPIRGLRNAVLSLIGGQGRPANCGLRNDSEIQRFRPLKWIGPLRAVSGPNSQKGVFAVAGDL